MAKEKEKKPVEPVPYIPEYMRNAVVDTEKEKAEAIQREIKEAEKGTTPIPGTEYKVGQRISCKQNSIRVIAFVNGFVVACYGANQPFIDRPDTFAERVKRNL